MFTFVSPMHSKADVPKWLKTWFEVVHTHLGRYAKFLRCDNGGKFISKHFETILAERGIRLVTSAPYTRGDLMAPVDGCHCTTLYPLVVWSVFAGSHM
jgi:hypothetical protein